MTGGGAAAGRILRLGRPRARGALAIAIMAAAAVGTLSCPGAAQVPTVEDLSRLSLEELGDIDVTSVSKRPEPLSRAPAAVYVITQEDIRRSGATRLVDVLRLAPNLIVAQQAAQTHVISARGFNTNQAANKMLVLIDGRSIYTPLHGGVFWDQQQVLLDDVERIEVISGPGGTLWGANATNGVINVITRNAGDTQGGLATGHLGTIHDGAAGRFGGKLTDDVAYRVYGMTFERDQSELVNDAGTGDGWDGQQAGFRMDWDGTADDVTVQGDRFENFPNFGGEVSGHNLLGRWTHAFDGGSTAQLQVYYDRVERDTPGILFDFLETFDIEAQHDFALGAHRIVWGGGHRVSKDEFRPRISPFFTDPAEDTVNISHLFVQDEIALGDRLTLTLGTKFEYSSQSGFEYMPSVRAAWQVGEESLLWGAVSRAVRTPSRIDRDLVSPGILDKATDFRSEELVAYEIGYRAQLPRSSLSVSLYYHDYDDLRVLEVSPGPAPLKFGNAMHGYIYGAEAWGSYRLLDWWRLSAGLNLLRKSFELEAGALRFALDQHVGNDPEYQLFLRSAMNLTEDLQLDIGLRAVDDLPAPAVPGYLAIDARLGWQVTDGLELSVAGQNLFDPEHPEAGAALGRREVRRSVHVGARWSF